MSAWVCTCASAHLRVCACAYPHRYTHTRAHGRAPSLRDWGFPVEKIEDMSAGEAEEHIAALYGDELYGLELDGEVSGEGAMRCACSPVHDEVRGICEMLGLDFTRVDRIATGRAGMLWAGEGMPHRFDACFENPGACAAPADGAADGASRSESAGSRKQPRY